jgi:hypothetical protein
MRRLWFWGGPCIEDASQEVKSAGPERFGHEKVDERENNPEDESVGHEGVGCDWACTERFFKVIAEPIWYIRAEWAKASWVLSTSNVRIQLARIG